MMWAKCRVFSGNHLNPYTNMLEHVIVCVCVCVCVYVSHARAHIPVTHKHHTFYN